MQHRPDLSDLLDRAQDGDPQALDTLFASTYQELRKLARARLRAGGRDTLLDTTSLVHESYLRLAKGGELQLANRLHFMHYASRAMRFVIVDMVRKRQAGRHGGSAIHLALSDQIVSNDALAGEKEILRMHQALDDLAKLDHRMAQVVEMRYFGGMTESEIAQALGVTDRTVRRDWEKARLLLTKSLT
jgi:RNA polymerase sigma factor (TIGR02999 family)